MAEEESQESAASATGGNLIDWSHQMAHWPETIPRSSHPGSRTLLRDSRTYARRCTSFTKSWIPKAARNPGTWELIRGVPGPGPLCGHPTFPTTQTTPSSRMRSKDDRFLPEELAAKWIKVTGRRLRNPIACWGPREPPVSAKGLGSHRVPFASGTGPTPASVRCLGKWHTT